MTTDDERRRVARILRGGYDVVSDAYGRFWLNGTLFGLNIMARSEERIRDGLSRLADLIEPQEITGDTSDGYHTFDELYDHRARLFSVIVRDHRELAWKSRFHHDDTMYDGMFIVGIETPGGQATYHYDIDPYWDIFDCKELVRAPEWDGHTPEQAISRIASLRPSCDRDALLALADEMGHPIKQAVWNQTAGVRREHIMAEYARRIREAIGGRDDWAGSGTA